MRARSTAISRTRSPPAEPYHLEVASREAVERRIEDAIVPARVHRTRDIQIAPVVGNDEAIGLHRAEDVLRDGRETRNVRRRFETEPGAHRERVRRAARPMRGGPDITVGLAHGHAKRMTDPSALRLVIAHETRQNRKTRGVGRRPPLGAPRVRGEIEYRSASRLP